jgi:ABC-type branched-subunit amino acid transport system substrate-binding protein
LPLTGPIATIGNNGKRGIEFAIRKRNEKFNGKKIIFHPLNTMGDPKEAITLFHGQIENQKPLMIYTMNTGVALNLQKLTEPKKFPLIAHVAAADFLKEDTHFSLRSLNSPEMLAQNLKNYLDKNYPEKTVKVFYENADYALNNKNALFSELKDRDVQFFDCDTTTQDYRTLLLKAQLDSNHDVVVLFGLSAMEGRMIRQMRQIDYEGDILGDAVLTAQSTAELAGDAMHNVYGLFLSKNTAEKTCVDLYNDYYSKYGVEMDETALLAYQSTDILLNFLEKHPDVKDLRKEMEGLIFDGCLGKTQVKDGQFVYPLEFIDVGQKQ